jgi:hypothetical protein
MELYINHLHYYTNTNEMRGIMYTVHRPPAVVIKSRATYETLNTIMDATIHACTTKYRHVLQDVEYLYWMEFLREIIRDEIDGYIRHQYSRIPSTGSHSFAKFIVREFNTLIVPVCNRIVNKNSNKEKRQKIIVQCNQQLQQCPCLDGTLERSPKVQFDTDANTLHVFERDDE